MVEIVAAWDPSSPQADQQHVQWAEDSSHALAAYALQGGYVNLLDTGEEDRVALTFASNYARLRALKRTYDPDDVFSSTSGHIVPSAF